MAFWTRYWDTGEPTHPECVRAVERTASILTDMGHNLEEQRPEFDYQALQAAFMKLWVSMSSQMVYGITSDPTLEEFEQYTLDLVSSAAISARPNSLLHVITL